VSIAGALALMLVAGGAPARPSWTGTWRSGGAKAAGDILVVVDDAQGVRFQLQLSLGAPSYNMGFLEGTLAVENGRATYQSDDEACVITFAFARETVAVKQERGSDFDCGFGHSVLATGTYRRVSRRKPQLNLLPK
jgi:hypothetical protein